MNSKVRVTSDEAGNTIRLSNNNPEFGHIRVEQTRIMIDEETGWARKQTLSALIPGDVETLKEMNLSKGQEIDGTVYVKESLKPFNEKDPERDYKMAGKTGVICKFDGAPIYRKSFYTPKLNHEDILIPHDNKEEIRQAQAKIKEQARLNTVETPSVEIPVESPIDEI